MRDVSEGQTTSTNEGSDAVAARRLVNESSSHAIFMLDPGGCVTTWPDPARSLYGYDIDDVLGRSFDVLFSDEEGNDDDPPPALLDEARDGTVTAERRHRRADGSTFWATVTVSPLWNDEFHGYAVISRDTTDRKEYERTLERQNDRLKEFSDILAHDLRNPLSIINGHLDLYRQTGEDRHVETIEETVDRMMRLVDDLLRVARQGSVVEDPERTDVETVVETAWEGTGHGSVATLQYDDIGLVNGDPDRLVQLFENLFRNSIEHGGSTVRVGPLDGGFYVEDDGPGIPTDIREDVFDHGFSTAEQNTGYGLSIVRTIVNAHGWDIAVTESEAGGARFEVSTVAIVAENPR